MTIERINYSSLESNLLKSFEMIMLFVILKLVLNNYITFFIFQNLLVVMKKWSNLINIKPILFYMIVRVIKKRCI